ncbi:MAG: winged helix-turn-helix transcriptional regulator [Nitrososphaeraceae archaeon]
MQQTRLDNIGLHIKRLLARDSGSPYKDIATAVGISSNAAKERINKMVSNGDRKVCSTYKSCNI